MKGLLDLIIGDPQADRAVPPTGMSVRLTAFVAAAMAFLAVLALALSTSAGRVADRWAQELAQAATLRMPLDATTEDVDLALNILRTTPGVHEARLLTDTEQQALLAPWFGTDFPLDVLPVPDLIEVIAANDPYDIAGLRARLSAELPGATLDDHARWRAPLIAAASRLRMVGMAVIVLIMIVMAAMVTLAAHAALAANVQVIRVLRLVGAKDIYIARAFVRRFTLTTVFGSMGGILLGVIVLLFLPGSGSSASFVTDIGFRGAGWLWPLVIPPLAAIVAFFAIRAAALKRLKEQT